MLRLAHRGVGAVLPRRAAPQALFKLGRMYATEPRAGGADEPLKPADPVKAEGATAGDTTDGPRGIVLQEHEGESLPPLAFEPGVAGAAQKGVSAVVIAFGAAALGACAWGASQALFPSASSTQSIFSEALDKVKENGDVAYALGTPLKGFGADHGGGRGRRNAMERWELSEQGADVSVVRFHVSGPQGVGTVQVQVPTNRKRDEVKLLRSELNKVLNAVLFGRRATLRLEQQVASLYRPWLGHSGEVQCMSQHRCTGYKNAGEESLGAVSSVRTCMLYCNQTFPGVPFFAYHSMEGMTAFANDPKGRCRCYDSPSCDLVPDSGYNLWSTTGRCDFVGELEQ